MATAFYDRTAVPAEKQKADLEAVSLATWAFVRSMKVSRRLQGEEGIGVFFVIW